MERVGGDRTIPVDVRVIVATHRNLDELVKKGAFRAGPVPSHLRVPAAAAAAARARWRTSRRWWRTSRRRSAQKRVEAEAVPAGRDRGAAALRAGRAMCASCATWWSGCCCWPTTRWTWRAVRLALPAQRKAMRRRRRHAFNGTLAERTDAFEREQILAELKRHRSAHDGYREGAGAGAQPSL